MKVILAILAALAAVTFPVYFVVYLFRAMALGLMALLVSVMWLVGQLFKKLNIFSKKERTNEIKLLRR